MRKYVQVFTTLTSIYIAMYTINAMYKFTYY